MPSEEAQKGDNLSPAKYETDISKLYAMIQTLLIASKMGLRVSEDWIHSELDGTSHLKPALAELGPIRTAIKKAERLQDTNA